ADKADHCGHHHDRYLGYGGHIHHTLRYDLRDSGNVTRKDRQRHMAGRRRSLKETKRMTARRKKQTRLLIMAGAGMILVALLAVYIQLRNYVNRVDRDVICDNVWIGAMDVSGMTAEEAGAALEGHMEADGAVTVTLQS